MFCALYPSCNICVHRAPLSRVGVNTCSCCVFVSGVRAGALACRLTLPWSVFLTGLVTAVWHFVALEASECLVGCTLLGVSPFDDDRTVEWDDRGSCDDSAGCEVETPNGSVTYWVGCGIGDMARCLFASSSGTDGSSDCTCSVCGGSNSFASSYLEDEPIWTRIACYVADMESLGYDASICVAAAIDDGTMACVEEAYEAPTSYTQFDCPSTGLGVVYVDDDVCAVSETTRYAEELFEFAGVTATPAPSIIDTPSPVGVPPTSYPVQDEELTTSGTGEDGHHKAREPGTTPKKCCRAYIAFRPLRPPPPKNQTTQTRVRQ